MSFNPAIIIPSYWGPRRKRASSDFDIFSFLNPIDKESPLEDCLAALSKLTDCPTVIIVVCAPQRIENAAYDRVCEITQKYRSLRTIIIGPGELTLLHRKMDESGFGKIKGCVGFYSQGSVKNLGIAIASIYGFDTLIFIGENKLVFQRDFMERALYGIGLKSPSGDLVAAKTGLYVDENNAYKLDEKDKNIFPQWNCNADINVVLEQAIKSARLSMAKTAFNGCMVLHAEVFSHCAFDPWICQNESQDYVLSTHMYGHSVWFDNKFCVRNNNADYGYKEKQEDVQLSNFKSSMLHWFYETRKIEFSKTQIDLLQIDPQDYSPYPANWFGKNIKGKAMAATVKGAFGSSVSTMFDIFTKTQSAASKFARQNCGKYFELQSYWNNFINEFWNNKPLAAQFKSDVSSSSASVTTTIKPV
ncbi:MAG: hypothetical protein MJ189_02415 [Coriobacteriales bacterium]|nr:hypothetical protein [Coriobacteriales bacterium]